MFKKLVLSLFLAVSMNANAGLELIQNDDSGWYEDQIGFHSSFEKNYTVGTDIIGFTYRNYFTFDLSGITDNIVSAAFALNTFDISETGVYTVYDVSTPVATLVDDNNDLGIYNDLGSGVTFGSINLTPADSNDIATITFNAAGISALNAALGGTFAIGGSWSGAGYAFGNSDLSNNVAFLETSNVTDPIPEPDTNMMLVAGLLFIASISRKKGLV